MKRYVNFSDLTGHPIDDDEHVTLTVVEHPELEHAVSLDASADELEALKPTSIELVVVEVHGERLTVELDAFEKLFSVDVGKALAGAGSVIVTAGRRDREELDRRRTWARANGWPTLSNRGRIPAEAEAAYDAAFRTT